MTTHETRSISIGEVVDLLCLEKNSNRSGDYAVICPFCGVPGSRKFHMSISESKNCYHCFKCDASGGVLDLYGRVALGEGLEKGPAGNGKRIYQSLIHALGSGEAENHVVRRTPVEDPYKDILPAPDSVLNKAYSEVLSQPWFQLTEEHKNKLLSRGLTNEAIIRNGYRSIPEDYGMSWFKYYDMYEVEKKRYMYGRLSIEKNSSDILRAYSDDAIIAGMCVAYECQKKGIRVNGVPGFYKLNDYWVFRLDKGMFVPTRNQKGEIIALQMRKDYGKLRYMTVSSKGLEAGPTTFISRPHFPLANCEISKDTMMLITEGPLKADVALDILNNQGYTNYAVVAVHGVNNRNELEDIFTRLQQAGVKQIFNAFDMDRTTNIHVQEACGKIDDLAASKGLEMKQLEWDCAFKGIDDFLKAQYIG